MSAVSPCGTMGKGCWRCWSTTCAGLQGTPLCPAVAWPQGQWRWAGVRLPSRHDTLVDYLQIFLKSQDVSHSLSVNKPGTEYMLRSLFSEIHGRCSKKGNRLQKLSIMRRGKARPPQEKVQLFTKSCEQISGN